MHLTAYSQDGSGEQNKKIEEIEKQLSDLKKKLSDLKAGAKKPLDYSDVALWRGIRGLSMSKDGEWVAYRVGPSEGDNDLVIKQVQGTKEYKFVVGSGLSQLGFANNSKWFAFTSSPPKQASSAITIPGLPKSNPQPKVTLVNLVTGEKVDVEGIRRFAFNGDAATHIAFQKFPSLPSSPSNPVGPTIPSLPPGLGSPTPTLPSSGGTDLLIRELNNGEELILGNIAEFGFDKAGTTLAMTIDAKDQVGNGIQIRKMTSGVIQTLESSKATYRNLNWSEKGEALTVLKGLDDPRYEGKLYQVVAFTGMPEKPEKLVFDPSKDTVFPKDFTIASGRPANFTDDFGGMLFDITEVKKKEGGFFNKKTEPKKEETKTEPKKDEPKPEVRKEIPVAKSPTPSGETKEKPDLVIWHWQDDSLQSEQQKKAPLEKNPSYQSIYHLKDKKFVRLEDEKLKNVAVLPKQRWGYGTDNKEYARMGSLDGKRFSDIYSVNIQTGERKLLLKKNRFFFGGSSDGTQVLYYLDGHFHTIELATGKDFNITQKVPTSFIDDEDDHPVDQPPRRPLGWSADGKFVLLSDGWDVWRVGAHGEDTGLNLTVNGKKDGIRYLSRVQIDPEEKGIDLSKPQYFSLFGEWTKKSGYGLLQPNQTAVKPLLWQDAQYGSLTKARNAEVFLFTRQTVKDYPDFYAVDANFLNPKRLTIANPQQENYAWCSGSQLVEYTNKKGKRLQGALFLPANYEKGKKYPTVVYIYEKLSDGLNRYTPPNFSGSGFNLALYTSNGYAVLMPDITYEINDPGLSSLGCVLPALDSAIATGIVDKDRVGLQGHSWGGYQTAFLVTQTNAFKAAVAGAPLTNLVSMYSSIYWNVGIANQPIFESSQGRFTGGYWEQWEAYVRNSPIYFAKNVQTPLMLLHNDKDGAVDFNQGIEYYNTLRRLQKPVIMLQYKGENHGLEKLANRRDYTIRMREYFDHYLMGKPAPTWIKEGVPHLKMDDHLKERLKD
jgi:dipeptidyl aminopeptidase/acylaminoacyl peptidase